MTRPGTNVVVLDSPPPRSAPTSTDPAFFVGFSESGPLGPDLVTSLTDFRTRYGARVSYGMLYDALEVYFREGGSRAYISRVVGPAAVSASRTLQDGAAANTLAVTAISPGAWGNNLTVQVATVTGGYTLTIRNGTTILEQSPTLVDKNAALDWAARSRYIKISVAGTGGTPATLAATALTAGNDDHAAAGDADWKIALDKFAKTLGPGQVLAPGNTSVTTQTNLLNHARDNQRRAILDAPDTAVTASLSSAAAAVRAAAPDTARYGSMWAPWVRIGGLTSDTTREVPPSPVIAGLIARSDTTGNPIGRPAANQNGQTRSVNALAQTYTSADLETLYAAQVNLIVDSYSGIMAYGDASLTNPASDPLWQGFAANRTVMAVASRGDAILQNHVFNVIDGQGREFTKLAGQLVSMLVPLWEEGSLYGDTFDEAARVDTGATVNTPDTIANRELHAVVAIRTSPAADLVELDLVRVATTESL